MTMTELFALTTESELRCEAHACRIDPESLRKTRETARAWLLSTGRIHQCLPQASVGPTSIEAFAFPDQDEFLQGAVLGDLTLDLMFERSTLCREYLLKLGRLGLACGCGCVGCGMPARISLENKPYFTSNTRNLRFLHS